MEARRPGEERENASKDDDAMSRTRIDIATLAFGAAVLLAFPPSATDTRRPPVGARAAIELVANRSGRKPAQAASSLAGGNINVVSRKNQSHLTAWRAPS
jgi:hypothetical protein